MLPLHNPRKHLGNLWFSDVLGAIEMEHSPDMGEFPRRDLPAQNQK